MIVTRQFIDDYTVSLTKDELNALWRNEGNVQFDVTYLHDGNEYALSVTLTTSETRDTFRKEK